MRKTTTAVAAVAVLLLPLAGCGKSNSTSNTGGGTGDLAGKTVQLIVGIKDDPFYITMTCGAQAEAQKQGAKFAANGGGPWDVSHQRPVPGPGAAPRPGGPRDDPGG